MPVDLQNLLQFGKSILANAQNSFFPSYLKEKKKPRDLSLTSQTFSEIIKNNQVYVDKTRQIYELIHLGKYLFLSRPRRFGKSLLITTLKELFAGNKDLFKGLWIHNKISWEKYPIIHIDMSKLPCDEDNILKQSLSRTIDKIALTNNIELEKDIHYQQKFSDLIESMAAKSLSGEKKVVVLIDEYDKPVIDYLHLTDQAEKHRKILHDFYSILKSNEVYLKFVFLTGVSRFSRMSIFSSLNNMIDISVKSLCTDIVGYTENEIATFFSLHIKSLSKKLEIDKKSVFKLLRHWYQGYSWDGNTILYNPQSIMFLFMHKCFEDYWSESGTPTFLIQLLKEKKISPDKFENVQTDLHDLASFEPKNIRMPVLLWQTGYLTIKNFKKNYDGSTKSITLGYPNHEVKLSFIKHLIHGFSTTTNGEVQTLTDKMVNSINDNDLNLFFKYMQNIFSLIPYQIFDSYYEKYYHTVIYITLTLIGFHKDIHAETQTNIGRIDATLITENKIYILEFKMDSAQKALQQIKNKKYANKYINHNKSIWLVGVSFSEKKKNINNWIIEKINNESQ